jgi:D-glycero-D-manno-heptose 1,7-bisphosphate phosphatase
MTKQKAIFLDRDGVVNELVYFPEQGIIDSPFTPDQFCLCPGVPLAIKRFQNKGYKVIIVSNQPGIAKGHITQNNFDRIDANMNTQLAAEGVSLDGIYYCLHHPKAIIEQYRSDCLCRKPKPGLILKAARDLNIDVSQSWYIGDNLTDIQAGVLTGCHTLLLGKMRCELCELMYREGIKPDVIKINLFEAADSILKGA